MKFIKSLQLFLCLILGVSLSYNSQAQYCTPTADFGTDVGILITTISGDTYNINKSTTCNPGPIMENLTATDSVNVTEDSSYTLSVSIASCWSFTSDNIGMQAWIDWNQNNVFDATESIGTWSGTVFSSTKTANFNFKVPLGATAGKTRMRILLNQVNGGITVPLPLDPCGNARFAAAQDLSVNVSLLPTLCPNPNNITTGVVTDSTANISWSSTETNFELEYGPEGYTQGNGTTQLVTGTSTTIDSLTAETSYDYYLRTDCSGAGNGYSTWFGPITFMTPCEAKILPYFNAFNTWPISCYDSLGGDFSFSNYMDSVHNCLMAEVQSLPKNHTAILTSPAIFIDSDAQVDFKWSHHKVTWANEKLFLAVREYGTTIWDTIFYKTSTDLSTLAGDAYSPGNFEDESYNLSSSYVGKSVEFRFGAIAGGWGSNIFLKDFHVKYQAPCAQLTGLSVMNILGNSVDVNLASAADTFIFEWGESGFLQGTGSFDTTATIPHTIDSLVPNTTYDLYARQYCSGIGYLSWVGPLTFTTACSDYGNLYDTNFDQDSTGTMPGCWSTLSTQAGVIAEVYKPSPSQNFQALSPPKLLRYSSGANSVLVSPEFSGIANNDRQVEFHARTIFGSATSSEIVIGTLGDPLDANTFVPFDTLIFSTTWTKFNVMLTSVPTGHHHIGFIFSSNSNGFTVAIDDFRLIDQPICLPPSHFKVSNLTSTSANISWNANDGLSWDLEYDLAGFQPGNGITVTGLTSSNYSLTGLAPNGIYDVYIKSNCTNVSIVAGPFRLKALCSPNSIPHKENFDSWPINCWVSNSGDREWTHYTDTQDSTAEAKLTYWTKGNDAVLRTRAYNISQTARVKFKWSHVSSKDELYLLTRIQPSDNWDTLKSWSGTNFESPYKGSNPDRFKPNNFVQEVLELDTATYNNEIVEFRLVAVSGYGANLFVDDFIVEPVPACPEPFNISVSGITGYEANANWSGDGSKYMIEYGLKGFSLGSGTLDSTTSNAYKFNGLTPISCYEFYIMNECGSLGNSPWEGPFEFCTDVSCPTPSNVELNNISLTDATLSWTPGSTSDFNYAYSTQPIVNMAPVTFGHTTNTVTLTNLTPATTYYFWVRDSCGPGDVSSWTQAFIFNTNCTSYGLDFLEDFNRWYHTGPLTCWRNDEGDKLWKSYIAGSDIMASLDVLNMGYGEVGKLTSPEIYISDTAVLQFEWSHMLNATFPDDSMFVLIKSINQNVWDTINAYGYGTFNVANATPTKPSPLMKQDAFDIDPSYIGKYVQIQFYVKSGSGSNVFVENVNIKEDAGKVNCIAPTQLNANNVTMNSAVIGWNGSNNGNWEVSFGVDLLNPRFGTKVVTNNNPYTLNNLLSGSSYSVFVREICGSGDTSAWSFPVRFNTSCGSFTMAYTEDFTSWVDPMHLPCWNLNGGTEYFTPEKIGTNTIAQTDMYDNWNMGQKAMMTSPEVMIDTNAILTVAWSKSFKTGTNDELFILSRVAGTTTWDTLSALGGQQFDCACGSSTNPNAPGQFITDTLALPASYIGQNIECAVHVAYGGGYNFYLNELSIEDDPAYVCPIPEDLKHVTSTCTGIALDWNSSSFSKNSNIIYGPKGFDPATSGIRINAVQSPYTITNLMAGTTYDIYVLDSCNITGESFMEMIEATTDTEPKPTVVATAVLGNPTVNNLNVQFDASNSTLATQYNWDFGDGNSSGSATTNHFYTANGTYTVVCSAINVCGSSDTTFTLLIEGISIEEELTAQSITLYPNPTQGVMNIAINRPSNELTKVTVMNMMGQVILNEQLLLAKGEGMLDLGTLPAGTYIVSLQIGTSHINKRIVIQH